MSSNIHKMRLICCLLLLFVPGCRETPRPTQEQAGQRGAALVEKLAGAEPTVDGISVMLVIDTSNSMTNKVRNASGAPEVKLAIAKRCAKSMVSRIHKFAEENKDRKIVVGIVGFNEAPYRVIAPQPISGGTLPFDKAIDKMRTGSGTAIGDAVVFAKKELDRTGYSRPNILTITDGENTRGENPAAVARALNQLPSKPPLFLIGFDVAATTFQAVKDAGSLVFSANDEAELLETTDHVMGTKILAEKPEAD